MRSNSNNQLVKLGDICREVKISTKNPLADGLERYIGLEHLDSNSLKIKRWGIIEEDSPSFTRVFKKGQILFGKRRPYLRKAAVADFDGICSGDIIVLEPTSLLEIKELLPFILQSDKLWEHAIKTSSGSLSPRTKWKSLADLELQKLSKNEQISTLQLLQKVEKILHLHDNLIDSLNILTENLLRTILLSPEGLKSNPLSIKDICKVEKNRVSPEKFKPEDKYIGFEEIEPMNYYSINPIGIDGIFSQKFSFKSGDILYGRIRPYLRKAAVTDFEGVCSSDLLVIRPKSRDYSIVLAAFFASAVFSSLAMNTAKGTKMPRADWRLLEKTKIANLDVAELKQLNKSLITLSKSLYILKNKKNNLVLLRQKIIGVV